MKSPLLLGFLVYTFIVASCRKIETSIEETTRTEKEQKIDTIDTNGDAAFVIEVNEEGELHVKTVIN